MEKKKDDCIFCKIAKGEIPSAKVYEDKDVIAFLDISPVNKGHTLVLPKHHYETIMETPEFLLHNIMDVIKKVSKVLVITKKGGVNVCQNNGKAAGQLVNHVHFHVIPRHEGDGHKFDWKNTKYKDAKEQEEYRKAIEAAVKAEL
ncbi:MAG: HIT family protein [Candidatus Woesearchaeota archaeon]